jgi:hypothetical protein
MQTAVARWMFITRRELGRSERQQRIVEMVLPDEGLTSEIKLQRRGPDERLSGGETGGDNLKDS